MIEERDDTILARWLAGKLNSREIEELENSENFEDYKAIAQGLESFLKPEYDKESLRRKILLAKETDKKKGIIRLKPWLYAAAAILLLLLGYGAFFQEMTYKTGAGETQVVILPDGSETKLSPGTKLSRKKYFWSRSSKVILEEGEAFFTVRPGSDFKVGTAFGDVSVLGTKFNIRLRHGEFVTECYQGKVKFEEKLSGEAMVLTKGEGVTIKEGIRETLKIEKEEPDWMRGLSTFKNSPLKQVIKEMETVYGVTFNSDGGFGEERFTGAFVHDDLQKALTAVLIPMDITFEIKEDGTITLWRE